MGSVAPRLLRRAIAATLAAGRLGARSVHASALTLSALRPSVAQAPCRWTVLRAPHRSDDPALGRSDRPPPRRWVSSVLFLRACFRACAFQALASSIWRLVTPTLGALRRSTAPAHGLLACSALCSISVGTLRLLRSSARSSAPTLVSSALLSDHLFSRPAAPGSRSSAQPIWCSSVPRCSLVSPCLSPATQRSAVPGAKRPRRSALLALGSAGSSLRCSWVVVPPALGTLTPPQCSAALAC